jgi:hypothetical protein
MIFFSNLIYMYFHRGLLTPKIQKMIYYHYFFKNSTIDIFDLLVHVGTML